MIPSAPVLLQTKLAMPSPRADRVPRPRLNRRLSTSLEHPLTLICAPAGFGKTTLITDWHEQFVTPDSPLAWFSLDEDDNDPTRFLMYLISALAGVSSLNGDELLSALYSPQPPSPKIILTALISQLELLPLSFTLILDDYHRITSQSIHEALAFLIDHLPAQMRLVITSREDPPLPLSRLRGRGQLAEIRADDLRFSSEEAAQFMQQTLDIHLSVEQVKELDLRTEGWIAGLQLAALAMRGHGDIVSFISAFTGSHRYILDYLTEEVLSQQSSMLQNFLLETSILNRLSGSLCNAVTGRIDGQSSLEQIEHSNLFLISLDDERRWYRYHHLFGDMLRQRLQQSHPARVLELHQRASVWFEQEGWISEAIEHALLGGDNEAAARIVEGHGERLWRHGELITIMRWLKALPETVLDAHPELGLTYAFILAVNDSHDEAGQRVTKVERTLLQQASTAEQTALLGEAAAIHATILVKLGDKGDLALAAGQQALAQLPASAVRWRGWLMMILGVLYYDAYGDVGEAERYTVEALELSEKANDTFTMMYALSNLTRMYIFRGRLRQAEVMSERLLQLAAAVGWKGQASLDRSRVRYERNELQGTLDDVIEAHRITQAYSSDRNLFEVNVLLARILQALGNESEARDLIEQAVEKVPYHQRGYFGWLFASQALLLLSQGDLLAAAQWAEKVELIITNQLDPSHEFERMVLARVQIARGKLDEAQWLLTQLFEAAQSAGRIGRLIGIGVLQSLAAQQQGNSEHALTTLENMLSLAQPENYVRVFVNEGVLMENLLRTLKPRTVFPAYVAKLLAAFEDKPPFKAAVALPQNWVGKQVETLSEREVEVLRLIADGASNREIAAQLVVSLGTVKKHLSNIFTKLDAHSRTQVVAVAREQNLL